MFRNEKSPGRESAGLGASARRGSAAARGLPADTGEPADREVYEARRDAPCSCGGKRRGRPAHRRPSAARSGGARWARGPSLFK